MKQLAKIATTIGTVALGISFLTLPAMAWRGNATCQESVITFRNTEFPNPDVSMDVVPDSDGIDPNWSKAKTVPGGAEVTFPDNGEVFVVTKWTDNHNSDTDQFTIDRTACQATPTETPIVVTPTETPVVVTPTETPVVVTPTETPIVVTPTETPVVVTPTETPVAPSFKIECDQGNTTIKNTSPIDSGKVLLLKGKDWSFRLYPEMAKSFLTEFLFTWEGSTDWHKSTTFCPTSDGETSEPTNGSKVFLPIVIR